MATQQPAEGEPGVDELALSQLEKSFSVEMNGPSLAAAPAAAAAAAAALRAAAALLVRQAGKRDSVDDGFAQCA